jgi:hypothetical protein
MSDAELDSWKSEWRQQPDLFAGLKRDIGKQNFFTALAVVVLLLGMALSAATALILGAYVWWAWRGSWQAAVQTTLAYAELSHRRAVAAARVLRFMILYLLIAVVLYGGYLAWNWRERSISAGLYLALLVAELLIFRYLLQPRSKRAIDEAAKLVDHVSELDNV